MNKELEALILSLEEFKLSKTAEFCILRFDREEALEMLKALTPPTEQEVCKALSEWLKENKPELWVKKVQHDTGGFHYYNNEDYEVYLVEYDEIDKTLVFTQWLPPRLITLIGRFYESEAHK